MTFYLGYINIKIKGQSVFTKENEKMTNQKQKISMSSFSIHIMPTYFKFLNIIWTRKFLWYLPKASLPYCVDICVPLQILPLTIHPIVKGLPRPAPLEIHKRKVFLFNPFTSGSHPQEKFYMTGNTCTLLRLLPGLRKLTVRIWWHLQNFTLFKCHHLDNIFISSYSS